MHVTKIGPFRHSFSSDVSRTEFFSQIEFPFLEASFVTKPP